MSKRRIHLIVLALNAICLLLILQIDFGFIPLISVEIFEERTTKINALISNLSQGILISSIFYFLLVYIPEYSKQKSIRIIIQRGLGVIIDDMRTITAYLDYKYDLGVDFNDINISCFLNLKDLVDGEVNFFYKLLDSSNKTQGPYGIGMTEFQYLTQSRSIILAQIQKILQEPGIIFEDEKLIETLSKLRDCKYLSSVEFLCTSKYDHMSTGKKTSEGFSKGVYDFFILFNELLKYYTPQKLVVLSTKAQTVT